MKNHFIFTRQFYVRMVILLVVFTILVVNALGFWYFDFEPGLKVASFSLVPQSLFADELKKILPASFLLCLTLPLLNPIKASLATLLIAFYILFVGLNSQSQESHLLLEFGLLSVAIIFSVHVLLAFFTEYHARQKLSAVFSQYIPPELVQTYSARPNPEDLQGVARELSIMFCDIQGFTALSEGMEPRQLTLMLNKFMTEVTRVILKHKGTIDKYIGDTVMAFWGAPLSDALHAQHALDAALEIQNMLPELANTFKAKGWPQLACGVGLNSGICNVGNMGSEFRLAYTAIGDAVNIASRLESLSRRYRVPIIAGEATVAHLPQRQWRELDCVKVRGHSQYIKIYQPFTDSDEALQRYRAALQHYRNQEWQAAWKIFNDLHAEYPQDYLYKLYKASVHYYEQHPPPQDWPGMSADLKAI